MDNTQEFRCISLFTGYAGIELGVRRAVPALRTVCYVEIEAFACANLVAKMEEGLLDAAPVWTDIKTFDGRPFRKRVHIITAGYPCQGESHAGKRKGQSDPRWLWPHIERIIETVQPVWFFGENVRGHLSLGYPTVYRSLRNLGYKVESRLFSAAECGAPHQRCRLFILAKSSRAASGNQDGQIEGGTRQENVSQENGETGAASELADTELNGLPTAQDGKGYGEISQGASQGKDKSKQPQGENRTRILQCLWPSRPGQPQYEWEEPRVVDDTTKRTMRSKHKHKPQGQNKSNSFTGTITSRNKTKGQAEPQLGGAANGTGSGLDIAIGDNNEKMQGMSKTDSQQGLEESKVLQPEMLLGITNESPTKYGDKKKKSATKAQGRNVQLLQQHKVDRATSPEQNKRCGDGIVSTMPSTNTQLQQRNSMRIDRLRLLGNGVVPQQAEKAFRELFLSHV